MSSLSTNQASALDTFQLFYEELETRTPNGRIRRLRPAGS